MTAVLALILLFLQGPVLPGSQIGTVTGQVLAMDGSPAASVRISALAAPESGIPATGASTMASLAQTDSSGRYRLEGIPPGRYYITAGFLDTPTYYPGVRAVTDARVLTVTPGSTIDNVDFSLARPAGVRVRGRVAGIPAGIPPGLIRITMAPAAPLTTSFMTPLNVPVEMDGTFEFVKVPPGVYNARILPASSPATIRVEVDDRDLSGIEVTTPPFVSGRVALEDGGALPIQAAALAAGIADPPALVRFTAVRTDTVASSMSGVVRGDGWFLLSLPAGEYRLSAALLPLGYEIKSMFLGPLNLLDQPLRVTGPPSSPIHITLTRTRPEAGFTVSGRVVGLPDGASATGWVSMQRTVSTGGMSVQRIAELPLRPDGTFEIAEVPSGTYLIRTVMPNALSQTQNIVVSNSDIRGLELKYATPAANLTAVTSVLQAVGGVITLTAPPPPPPAAFRLRGRVIVVPGTALPQTMRLRSFPPSGLGIDGRVNPDGTFEFASVAAGEYSLMVDSAPSTGRNFSFTGQDVNGIEVKVPVLVRGRVVLADGVAPSALFPMLIRNVSQAGSSGGARTGPTLERLYEIQPDGTFTAEVYPGEQQISVSGLSAAHSVKSISFGPADILSRPLRIDGPTKSEIIVTVAPR